MDVANIKEIIRYYDPYSIRDEIIKESQNKEWYGLAMESHRLKLTNEIDKLIIEELLRPKITFFNFQLETALRVLNELHGQALLADEVGLGKTIEAGLIVKELLARQRIKTLLICSPPTLIQQWKDEMSAKFGEVIFSPYDHEFSGYLETDKVICSLEKLVRDREKIMSKNWDMVIVDEAHLLNNPDTKRRSAVSGLSRRHLLLLTATPLQNNLSDLYSLMDLLYPGMLGSKHTFLKTYSVDGKGKSVRNSNVEQLRNYLARVMCRTRREDSGIPFVSRHVHTREIEGTKLEYELVDKVTKYLSQLHDRRILKGAKHRGLYFEVIPLQQSLSSSPKALIASLENRTNNYPAEKKDLDKLIDLAHSIELPSKVNLLLQVISEIPDEQVIIFTIRKATASHLESVLNDRGKSVSSYMGNNSSRHHQEELVKLFQSGKIQYLVATDLAGIGLNLQNCSIMINFDLHWNPMKLEQRIGRIHRLGQDREVTIFNLVLSKTIDEYVVKKLFEKLELYRNTIGGFEAILGELESDENSLDQIIMDAILRSRNRIDLEQQIEEISNDAEEKARNREFAAQFTKGVVG